MSSSPVLHDLQFHFLQDHFFDTMFLGRELKFKNNCGELVNFREPKALADARVRIGTVTNSPKPGDFSVHTLGFSAIPLYVGGDRSKVHSHELIISAHKSQISLLPEKQYTLFSILLSLANDIAADQRTQGFFGTSSLHNPFAFNPVLTHIVLFLPFAFPEEFGFFGLPVPNGERQVTVMQAILCTKEEAEWFEEADLQFAHEYLEAQGVDLSDLSRKQFPIPKK